MFKLVSHHVPEQSRKRNAGALFTKPLLLNIEINGHVRPMLDEAKMKLGWAIPSPDGKHLAIWKDSGSSNAWMLENF